MKKWMLTAAVIISVIMLAACNAGQETAQSDSAVVSESPAGVPARPGSGQTHDPSVNLDELREVTGVVKEADGDLVLIELSDGGGEYMLRFTENTVWTEGIDQDIQAGNTITCTVRPEPTFTTPSQGEVTEVLSKTAAG